jgi:hypothetical protein
MTARRRAQAAALVLFLISRLYLLFVFVPDQSDMYLYFQYAWEDEVARAQGVPLYRFHTEQFDRAQAAAFRRGEGGPMPETRSIEYPPLTLQSIVGPKAFLARPDVRAARPEDWPLTGDIPGYALAFRATMAMLDAVAFLLLLWLVPRLFPRESVAAHVERWAAYIAAGHLLGHLIYDRLSLPPGVMMLAGLALLTVPRLPPLLGLTLLAAAVNYQLSPLVLVPVFVLASLAMSRLRGGIGGLTAAVIGRGLLAAVLIVALFAPFYSREGSACLEFLRYQGQRGLQIESVAATLPLLLTFFGHAAVPVGEYGAWHLHSSITPFLAAASPAAVAALALLAALQMLLFARRVPKFPRNERFAVAYGASFAGFAVATLAGTILASKVFSPQYLLWLLPLVPVVPARRPTLALFVAVAGLTSVIFPYAYEQVAAWIQDPVTGEMTVRATTTIGKVLLAARNVLFVVFTVVVYRTAPRLRPG